MWCEGLQNPLFQFPKAHINHHWVSLAFQFRLELEFKQCCFHHVHLTLTTIH